MTPPDNSFFAPSLIHRFLSLIFFLILSSLGGLLCLGFFASMPGYYTQRIDPKEFRGELTSWNVIRGAFLRGISPKKDLYLNTYQLNDWSANTFSNPSTNTSILGFLTVSPQAPVFFIRKGEYFVLLPLDLSFLFWKSKEATWLQTEGHFEMAYPEAYFRYFPEKVYLGLAPIPSFLWSFIENPLKIFYQNSKEYRDLRSKWQALLNVDVKGDRLILSQKRRSLKEKSTGKGTSSQRSHTSTSTPQEDPKTNEGTSDVNFHKVQKDEVMTNAVEGTIPVEVKKEPSVTTNAPEDDHLQRQIAPASVTSNIPEGGEIRKVDLGPPEPTSNMPKNSAS